MKSRNLQQLTDSAATAEEPRNQPRRGLPAWVPVILLAVAINMFLFTTVGIRGDSMEPTLHSGERALVPRFEVWWQRLAGSGYDRGDVVFFPNPVARDCGWRCPWVIKRIVGLPGETVSIDNGTVSINGEPLPEPYLQDEWRGSFTMGPVRVPAGSYFVLGDNRYPYGSQDSRSYGPVDAGTVAGRVSAILWPPLRSGEDGLELNWRGLGRP